MNRTIPDSESLTIEFKSDHSRLPDRDLVTAVVCLANTEGGELYLGVEKDGAVTGLHPEHQNLATLTALIANRTSPPVSVRVTALQEVDKTIARIEIPKSMRLVATAEGLLQRRRLQADGTPQCVPFHPHDRRCQPSVGPGRARLRGAARGPSDRGRFRSAGARAPAPTCGTLRRRSSAADVERRGVGRRIRLHPYRGSAPCTHRCRAPHPGPRSCFARTPADARSGLSGARRHPGAGQCNALTHRDYTRLGAVHVRWETDGLIISSPGGFVEGVTLDNLLVVEPKPRNPLLADAIKRIGLTERTGRGVDLIYEGLLRYGRPAPDYTRSDPTTVVVRRSSAQADIPFLQMIIAEEERTGVRMPLDSLIVLARLRTERRLDVQAVAAAIQKNEAVARAVLERLVEAGLIEGRGATRGRTYTLSAQVYQWLGQGADYIRQAGFGPIQQEQMVLQYARTQGRITRSEAAELCRLSPDQAKRLLLRMVEEGQLTQQGAGKATHYELASNMRARPHFLSIADGMRRVTAAAVLTDARLRRRVYRSLSQDTSTLSLAHTETLRYDSAHGW